MRENVCRVCLIEHDEEIHEATLSLRSWLRESVEQMIMTEQYEEVLSEPVEDLNPAA
jgi:hypothetical protein